VSPIGRLTVETSIGSLDLVSSLFVRPVLILDRSQRTAPTNAMLSEEDRRHSLIAFSDTTFYGESFCKNHPHLVAPLFVPPDSNANPNGLISST
jgi:hypothetical protein